METKISNKKQIPEAVEPLKKSKLVAFLTETVYGLGALVANEKVVKGVYAAKGRPSDNPLIVTVSDEKMMEDYANEVPERTKKLIKHFWPGPLIIILFIKEGTLPDAVTKGLSTAAFHCPDGEMIYDLISEPGKPIVGPSANTPTKPSPTTTKHIYYDLKGRIAGIADSEPTEIGLESTIVDLSAEIPTVLRPGEVTPEKISKVLEEEVLVSKGTTKIRDVPRAPGMKYHRHVPSAPVSIIDEEADFSKIKWDKEAGVAALDEVLDKTDSSNKYSLGRTISKTAHDLLDALRCSGSENSIRRVYVQGSDHGAISPAYMNHLNKAAAGYYFH